MWNNLWSSLNVMRLTWQPGQMPCLDEQSFNLCFPDQLWHCNPTTWGCCCLPVPYRGIHTDILEEEISYLTYGNCGSSRCCSPCRSCDPSLPLESSTSMGFELWCNWWRDASVLPFIPLEEAQCACCGCRIEQLKKFSLQIYPVSLLALVLDVYIRSDTSSDCCTVCTQCKLPINHGRDFSPLPELYLSSICQPISAIQEDPVIHWHAVL